VGGVTSNNRYHLIDLESILRSLHANSIDRLIDCEILPLLVVTKCESNIPKEITPPQQSTRQTNPTPTQYRRFQDPTSKKKKLSLPRRKYQIQLPGINSEVILSLRQNPRPILARRKRHIKLEQNPRRQRADLHVRQILADAAEGAHGERRESVLVLDQLVALAVPAFGEEGGGGGVDAVV
jgi:hypothetical protein